MKVRIKIHGILIFSAVVILAIFYKQVLPVGRERMLNDTLGILGFFMVVVGYLLRIAARGYKSELNPDGKTLVTQGPYLFTRNPMYLGTLLIGWGVTLVFFRWWVGLVFLAVYLSIYLPEMRKEERVLSARFGNAFRDYCRMTPQYFPNLIKLVSTCPSQYLQIKGSWVKKELSSFLPLLLAVLLFELWEDHRLLGRTDYQLELTQVLLLAAVAGFVTLISYAKKDISGKGKDCCQ